jgi:polyisoprenoid-binding protein YceI
MMERWLIIFALVFPWAANVHAESTTWEIDPGHSSALFSVRHLMVANVRGELGKVTGVLQFDDKNPALSTVVATIDTSMINTREPKRDAHLKSAEFFEVEKYPSITFKSKQVTQDSSGKLKVTGDLTIKNATREIVLWVDGPTAEVKDLWGNLRRGASATARLNRKDFGLLYNKTLETGGVLVGDEVDVSIEVELLRKLVPSKTAFSPSKE